MGNTTKIQNKTAHFDYFIEEKEVAGIMLVGSEMKPLRSGMASIADAFVWIDEEGKNAYIKNMYIKNINNNAYSHEEKRDRKLLMTREQLGKWKKKSQKGSGKTIIALSAFFDVTGIFKVEIGLGKGKKNWDKKDTIKERDVKKETERELLK